MLNFKYPDPFPALSFPPSSEDRESAEGFAGSGGRVPNVEGALDRDEEESWLYYLAEISIRKIMDRILSEFYGKGEGFWLTDIAALIEQYELYSEELSLW